jgi:hypothetical protein
MHHNQLSYWLVSDNVSYHEMNIAIKEFQFTDMMQEIMANSRLQFG